MTIEEYFGDWSRVIDLNEADRLLRKAVNDSPICPLPKDIFKAFRLCSLKDLRLVICGLDPYPDMYKGNPRATGLVFANQKDTPSEDFSPSLKILMESVIDFTIPHGLINFDPSLEKWERQGVLLLNTALSCRRGRVGSHTLLWWPFMKSLITNLSKHTTGIVYVLMGTQAQGLEPFINKGFNHVIRIRHPSWYARTCAKMPHSIWNDINQILVGQNGTAIKWFEEISY